MKNCERSCIGRNGMVGNSRKQKEMGMMQIRSVKFEEANRLSTLVGREANEAVNVIPVWASWR